MATNMEIIGWCEEAQADITRNVGYDTLWQKRYLELYSELEKANKTIDSLFKY